MREIEATAYHEAGHAVAAFHLGRPISRVTITPDGNVLGSVRHYPIRGKWLQPDVVIDTRTEKFLEASITVLLAGPSAERKARGRWNHTGASSDRERAGDLAFRLVGSEKQLQRYWAWREQIASDLWENAYVWEQVQRLAAELLKRKTMSGRAVREVLEGEVRGMDETPRERERRRHPPTSTR
jgi:hypothetical protein